MGAARPRRAADPQTPPRAARNGRPVRRGTHRGAPAPAHERRPGRVRQSVRARLRGGAGAGPYPAGSLNRRLVELAIATGIPPAAWAEEGEQAIVTALELLERRPAEDPAGR